MKIHVTEDKWDHRFLDLAEHIAGWSKDPSTQVGAVIASFDHRIISHGFNGYPKGVDDAVLSREQKLLRTIHAEANALHFAGPSASGCSVYVTHPPCANCAAHIIQRDIVRVVFNQPDPHFMERWADSFMEAMLMFSEAKVLISQRIKS